MVVYAFITHKVAEHYIDCQDRFSVNIDTKSVAVSDGMGSTWQQKIWAKLLVETFANDASWDPNVESIKQLSSIWKQQVIEFIDRQRKEDVHPSVIFRNERNLVGGKSAGATFVGIRYNGNEWKGTVLGDSCLIVWDGEKAEFYTSQDGDEFDSYPDYFDSDSMKQGKGTPKSISGHVATANTYFLVSDPFSDFLLRKKKNGDIKDYLIQLIDTTTHEDFETIVSQWRKEGMHNDDTTLVVIKPSSNDSFELGVIDDLDKLIDEENDSSRKANSSTLNNAETLPITSINRVEQRQQTSVMQIQSLDETNSRQEGQPDFVDDICSEVVSCFRQFCFDKNRGKRLGGKILSGKIKKALIPEMEILIKESIVRILRKYHITKNE